MSFHSHVRIFLFLLSAVAFMTACAGSIEHQAPTAANIPVPMDTLVTAEWLERHLDDPDLVVLDSTVLIEPADGGGLRNVNGRANFEQGHIPGAGFADLMGNLSDANGPYPYSLPEPEQFAAAMSALGVSDDSRVVLYDANRSVWAARVWWMLRWIGFDRAALLDGGLNAWKAAGGRLSHEPGSHPQGKLTVTLRPDLIADRNEVLASIHKETVDIVDALPAAHYRGTMAMYARPGHITGALNVPTTSLVDETGRLLSSDALAAVLKGDRDRRAINYCGGGIAASFNAFVMTRMGYSDVAVYDASLQEWAANSDNPMEVSPDPDWADD